jgi:hypothetical protein
MIKQTMASFPKRLREILDELSSPSEVDRIAKKLRNPDALMTGPHLGAMKSTRLSFANLLARRMIKERWIIRREEFSCDADGDGHAVYRIDAGSYPLTYIARCYPWDGIEKAGRRSDGAQRDMFGAIFLGTPTRDRIGEEFATFDLRDASVMRTKSDVTGWTPANRSVRFFEHVVNALSNGQQPDAAFLGSGTGYILRNGGYLGSGRQGSLSIDGLPQDHPFRHPFFADLFGLYMVRQISIDLVNAVAKARNQGAAQLEPDIARYIGVGNSSGQGMCVALQRWPEWVSAWLTVRELALAHAKTREVTASEIARLDSILARACDYYESIELPCEDYVVPTAQIAKNLGIIRQQLSQNNKWLSWDQYAASVANEFDIETTEQFNSLLIELYPDFSYALADYLPSAMTVTRDVAPESKVHDVRRLLRENYSWALRCDLRISSARRYFWYHSIDNGEQRRGERGIDPHEEFESFIDHIGLIQHVSNVLATHADDDRVSDVLIGNPDLYYGLARVQYLADMPYAEIRDSLIDQKFIPAHLIRFFLSALGMESTSPLSIRYVRGVFFQGMPLPHEIARGVSDEWNFPFQPRNRDREAVA